MSILKFILNKLRNIRPTLNSYKKRALNKIKGKYRKIRRELRNLKNKDYRYYKYYYETGQLLKIEYYSNGEKTGEWKYYKKNGELKRTKTY